MNLRTRQTQIEVMSQCTPKNVIINPRWEGSFSVLTDSWILNYNLQHSQYWVNYGFKFTGLEQNEEYVEREDEFDKKQLMQTSKVTDEQLNNKQGLIELSLPKKNKYVINKHISLNWQFYLLFLV